ncbi:hypothetical protein AgCh_038056 [Apium graveolens]
MLAPDRLDLKDIKVLRERSLHKMKKMVEKRRQGVALGYGEYMEIYVLKVFFSVVKASDRVVCQFYCENWPFKRSSGLTTGAIAGLKDCWVPTTKRVLSRTPKRRGAFAHVRFPFKTSDKNKAILQKIGRRHLLQDDNDYIILSNIVIVSQDGTGDFTTINDALTLAPNKTVASDGYFVIYVIVETVITGNHSTADGLATFNSAIFAVVGQGFVAVNITFQNTAGAVNHQAVAMRSRAYMSTFYSCSFEGYQDTLYPHSNRQFYTECDIYGTVDFIFGNGAAVLQDCNIYPLYILQVMKERAKNRVDDLQGMFCDLKLARKESRTNDVALLEEQVNQMLGEWQSVLNHPSPATSF